MRVNVKDHHNPLMRIDPSGHRTEAQLKTELDGLNKSYNSAKSYNAGLGVISDIERQIQAKKTELAAAQKSNAKSSVSKSMDAAKKANASLETIMEIDRIINGALSGENNSNNGNKQSSSQSHSTNVYGSNTANIVVNQTEKDESQWYRNSDIVIEKDIVYVSSTWNSSGKNSAGVGIYSFDYNAQEYMRSSCDTVINKYINRGANQKTVDFLNHYLNPELIIAIGMTESGWVEGENNKTGMTPSGASITSNCIGGESASKQLADYMNFESSVSATAIHMAHLIEEQLNGGYTDVYDNNYTNNGSINDAQVIYNALYSYGVGRTKGGYSYTEAAMSSAYKIYLYEETYRQRNNTEIFLQDAHPIGKLTNDEWNFSFESNKTL